MALSIQTNMAQMTAMTRMNQSSSASQTAMERLATGFRINKASDDAAGLQIANRLTAQSKGINVAIRNAQDATGMLQSADASLSEITDIAYRMKELATQSANDTNTAADRSALNDEYQELKTEVTRIMQNTKFGGETLLEGGKLAAAVNFQIGEDAADVLAFDASAEIGAITTAYGATVDITTQGTASTEIGAVDTLIDAVGTARSKMGANVNRLEFTINNQTAVAQGADAAKGRIMDADFAVETANMSKQQILQQAGVSVLAQAKQSGQLVASLLR